MARPPLGGPDPPRVRQIKELSSRGRCRPGRLGRLKGLWGGFKAEVQLSAPEVQEEGSLPAARQRST